MFDSTIAPSATYNVYAPTALPEIEPNAILPLAFPTVKLTQYIGQVASSWAWKPGTFTIHLHPGLTWQNGKPVVATDVIDTVLLNGLVNGGLGNLFTGMDAPNPHTVVFKLLPHVSAYDMESTILPVSPVASSVYGRFLPPHAEHDLIAYAKLLATNPKSAPSTTLGKTITGAVKNLEAFHPTRVVGDGPFRVTGHTTSSIRFVRWPKSPFAKHVHVRVFIAENVSGTSEPGTMFSHQMDYSNSGFSGAIVKRIKQDPVLHYYTVPFSWVDTININNKRYPLNMLAVRKALAYLIDRPKYAVLQSGGPGIMEASKHPDLLPHVIEHLFLTKKQLHSLNPYNHNPSRAAALLKSAGFTKRAGQWYMPNGKQFTLTFDGPAGWVPQQNAPLVAANVLTPFGIRTKAVELPVTTLFAAYTSGNYQLAWNFGPASFNPIVGYDKVLGGSENYSTPSVPGLGFGPMAAVPGLGKENVPQLLNQEATTVSPGPRMRALVWDWARLVNQQLPVIPYASQEAPVTISTARYTHWPPKNSPLWSRFFTSTGGVLLLMEHGYVRPK